MVASTSLPTTLTCVADREAIVDAIAAIVSGGNVERILLFGSKARGDDDAESDIDLLVITTDEVTPAQEDAMNDAAWDAGITHGKVVQLVIRSHERWWHGVDQATPLRRQIDVDGIEIYHQ